MYKDSDLYHREHSVLPLERPVLQCYTVGSWNFKEHTNGVSG